MQDVLYLHGFGETKPRNCAVAHGLWRALPDYHVHVPSYHPGEDILATRVGAALESLEQLIERMPEGRVHLVGYSFGGLLAALLAERRPDLIGNVLLLAPAIDNFARNYQGRDPAAWRMPREYVEELHTYPARPRIVRPTTLMHGRLDTDAGGSGPWRIEEWAAEQPFRQVLLLPGVDHSLEPWLSTGSCGETQREPRRIPTFHELAALLVAE
jgi:pimeloyl-ACP methyl ester carboxylesterase